MANLRKSDFGVRVLGHLQNSCFEKLLPLLLKREEILLKLEKLIYAPTRSLWLEDNVVEWSFDKHEDWIRECCSSDLRRFSRPVVEGFEGESPNKLVVPSKEELTQRVLSHIDVYAENKIRSSEEDRLSEKLQRKVKVLRSHHSGLPAFTKMTTEPDAMARFFNTEAWDEREAALGTRMFLTNPTIPSSSKHAEPQSHLADRNQMRIWCKDAVKILLMEGILPGHHHLGPLWDWVRCTQCAIPIFDAMEEVQETDKNLNSAETRCRDFRKIVKDCQTCLYHDDVVEGDTADFAIEVGMRTVEIYKEKMKLKVVDEELLEVIPQLILFSREARFSLV